MAYLKFYVKEREIYANHMVYFADKDAVTIVNKLVRHFKLYVNRYNLTKAGVVRRKYPPVRFFGNRQSGACYNCETIRLSHNPSLVLIVHEVAHLKHHKHDKKMMKFIGRMLAYCEKNNYWNFTHDANRKPIRQPKLCLLCADPVLSGRMLRFYGCVCSKCVQSAGIDGKIDGVYDALNRVPFNERRKVALKAWKEMLLPIKQSIKVV